MDLKRNQITVGELLDHPGARAVFQRRFPMLMKHPMLGAARTITLEHRRRRSTRLSVNSAGRRCKKGGSGTWPPPPCFMPAGGGAGGHTSAGNWGLRSGAGAGR